MPYLRVQLLHVQLAVGVRGGCVAAIHVIRSVLDHPPLCEQVMVLKLDIRNLFKSVRRDHILYVCDREAPSLLRLAVLTYAKPSELIHGNDVIRSETVIQEGDPIIPVLFAISIDDIAISVNTLINVCCLDDSIIVDSPSVISMILFT